MTDTTTPRTDDIVVLGDMTAPTEPPTLRLVNDDSRTTPPVAVAQPLPPLPPSRRHTPMQWLSFVMTMTAIAVLTALIAVFEPPVYLAAAVLTAVAVVGSLLIVAEVITERSNRRSPYGDMRTALDQHDSDTGTTAGHMSDGFDVYSLELDD